MENKEKCKSLQIRLATLKFELPFEIEIKEALKTNSDVKKLKL